MSFTTPDGTVGANDEIPVWVTLTTDFDFLFDASADIADIDVFGPPYLLPE